jgi:2-polyprenyl-6-hydroxyphenyl methylase/3-demethylubiquinone-9 3-methyltransferase
MSETMSQTQARAENVDPRESEQFDRAASRWWDPEGDFRPLHDINGPRVDWIRRRVDLDKLRALDVGCGGGLLSESLARAGASVTAIDMAEKALTVARMHQMEAGVEIDYQRRTAEDLADDRAGEFDLVCCLEMLEHVPDPVSVVRACVRLCRPGGQLVFSTINRSPLAWATAVVGAEYVLRLLPRGTHRYDRLIRPSELAGWLRSTGATVESIEGLNYNPFSRTVSIGGRPRVNYLLAARAPGEVS